MKKNPKHTSSSLSEDINALSELLTANINEYNIIMYEPNKQQASPHDILPSASYLPEHQRWETYDKKEEYTSEFNNHYDLVTKESFKQEDRLIRSKKSTSNY